MSLEHDTTAISVPYVKRRAGAARHRLTSCMPPCAMNTATSHCRKMQQSEKSDAKGRRMGAACSSSSVALPGGERVASSNKAKGLNSKELETKDAPTVTWWPCKHRKRIEGKKNRRKRMHPPRSPHILRHYVACQRAGSSHVIFGVAITQARRMRHRWPLQFLLVAREYIEIKMLHVRPLRCQPGRASVSGSLSRIDSSSKKTYKEPSEDQFPPPHVPSSTDADDELAGTKGYTKVSSQRSDRTLGDQ
ncbi:hypothetical protein B0H19DRAFT_1070322 [Mycena capillaripes]|nr:hypothetical protein B0H19DRAFT_1070322 [Mycena capillaripes]